MPTWVARMHPHAPLQSPCHSSGRNVLSRGSASERYEIAYSLSPRYPPPQLNSYEICNQFGIAAYPLLPTATQQLRIIRTRTKARGSDLESASGEDIDQVAEIVDDARARVDDRRVCTVEPPAVDLAVEVGADIRPCACTESPDAVIVPPAPPPPDHPSRQRDVANSARLACAAMRTGSGIVEVVRGHVEVDDVDVDFRLLAQSANARWHSARTHGMPSSPADVAP